MATIRAIEDRTIHQIQSGQVIVDICSVVKELVENSLDAGSTSIDVRFKNQGLDSIEVQDNGGGITADNYGTLALKHHTSKLSTYSDLSTLLTFGFRGEALSSLCALSKFTVTTCTAFDAPRGTKLDFETSGALKGTSILAAQKGTTVAVENLFHNLPVRRRELERNIKKEWSRVVGLLGQYACIQTGVKLSVTSLMGKGKRITLFSTKGNATTRENIVSVHGAKTLTALLPMDLNLQLSSTSGPNQRRSTQDDGGTKEIRILGHISRPAHGEGRQVPDRQMFYVNHRPCSLPQISKAFNEVYRAYNNTQSPFIFANIIMDTHMYDVNVSPDKRTILLHDQTKLLEGLKTSLCELFEQQDYIVPVSQLPAQKQTAYKQPTISRQTSFLPRSPETEVANSAREMEANEAEKSSQRQTTSDGKAAKDDERFVEQNRPNNPLSQNVVLNKPNDLGSQDREVISLVSDWLSNKSTDRTETKLKASGAASGDTRDTLFSGYKRTLAEKLSKESMTVNNAFESMQSTATRVVVEDLESDSLASYGTVSSKRLPITVRDFNRSLAEHDCCDSQPTPLDFVPDAEELASSSGQSTNSMLPLKVSPTKERESRTVTPLMATITIGNSTVTSSLRSPVLLEQHDIGRTGPVLPSFGNKLSQRFQAGYVDQKHRSHDGKEDEGDGEEQEPLVTAVGDPRRDLDFANENERTDGNRCESNLEIQEDEISYMTGTGISDLRYEINSEEQAEADYDAVDEEEKRAQEDAKVQEMVKAAEEMNAVQDHARRTQSFLRGGTKRKDATFNLVQIVATTATNIESAHQALANALSQYENVTGAQDDVENVLHREDAEEKLSLTINKTDFAEMKIIGQFNLGFILALRKSNPAEHGIMHQAGDVFIIDQHASDEKYNFERLQKTTLVQSQPLAHPKTLDLTVVEEEIVLENLSALSANGFNIKVDQSGDLPVGHRCQLLTLPLSRQTIFSLKDLEELISMLSEAPRPSEDGSCGGSIVRPSKVRKMFAMRACRSSIMIGKTLGQGQMRKVVSHLGELDKPWNCPHGRPTMRHLCGLGRWDSTGWREGDGVGEHNGERQEVDWSRWAGEKNRDLRK